jgi:hypothetical protein
VARIVFGKMFEQFVQSTPICVMNRALLENIFAPEKLDALFEHLGRRFDLPEQLVALGIAAIVEILHLDRVQPPRRTMGIIGFDRPDGRQPIADTHGLADFWKRYHQLVSEQELRAG